MLPLDQQLRPKQMRNLLELELQVVDTAWYSLTGNFQNTNKPKTIRISDITQETAGLLILNSVISIYLFIGFIFPRGLTFFNPSATIISPCVRPEIISILLSF